MNNLKYNYRIFALSGILMWSLGFVVTRLSLTYWHPLSVAFARFFVASLVLAGIAVAYKIKPPDKEDWLMYIFCGVSGHAIYITFFKLASVTLTASTNAIIIAMGPILIAVLAWVVYREKLKTVQTVAFAMAFSGILVMTLIGGSVEANIGVVLMFTGVLFLAAFNLALRKLVAKYSPLQATIYTIIIGTVALSVFIPQTIADIRSPVPPVAYAYVIGLGVFPTVLSFLAWGWAMKTAPKVSYVTNFMFLTPFLTTLFGFLLANEVPGVETFLGGVLILTGLAIFNFHATMAVWLKKVMAGGKV